MAIFQYNPQRPFRSNPDLHLHYWGQEQCVPGHSVGPGVRDLYKIHFIHAGTGKVCVGEQTHVLRAGQAFLTYPHIVTYYAADSAEPWLYSWVAFTGEQIEWILSKTSLSPEYPVMEMDDTVMPNLYERLTAASESMEGVDLPLKAVMYEFFSLLLKTVPAPAEPFPITRQRNSYIEEALHYLQAHYCENITVELLSSSLKLDRKYFSALFKRSVGMPPQQYLLQFRMAKACELLAESHCSVGEISRSVGYQDPLLFSRMFKKVKGCSPKTYRNLHAQDDIVL